jgi:cytochrome c5
MYEQTVRKGKRPAESVAAFVAVLLTTMLPVSAGAVDRSGKEVVEAVCIACHGSGADGAPKIGDNTAWAPRAERGLTGLTQSAITGIRKMPPHGGSPGLSDAELERAITYMINASGGNWSEPIPRTAPVIDRSGEQVVRMQCANCHETGVAGAPKMGDRAAWIPRLKQGFDVLVRSAINGHGGMPPRGGIANLTDPEIRAAIAHLLNPVPAAAGTAPAVVSAPDPNHRTLEGTEIFFGLTSAETLRAQHPGSDAEATMHGSIPRGKDYYHVNVSLFDAQTHSPITDADVEVKIVDPLRGNQVKLLELMGSANALSYGNYFRLPGKDPYTIDVSIRRTGALRPIATTFVFRK